MTPAERVKEIEERLKAASPGPWALYGIAFQNVRTEVFLMSEFLRYKIGYKPDAVFIASAPTDIAFLLARVEKLEEALFRIAENDAAYAPAFQIARAALEGEKE